MSAVALTPDLKTPPQQPVLDANQWTDTKVKRVWAAALAGVSLAGAAACTALAFTVSLWFLAPAVPLLIAGGGLIWYCCTSVDYDNPKELFKIRETASKMSLPQIVETHGWGNLTRYEILTPAQFEQAYAAQAQKLTLHDLIWYYENTQRSLDRVSAGAQFHVPEPKLWKGKFKQETSVLPFHAILALCCGIDSALFRYGIISEKEMSFLTEGYKTLNFYTSKIDECEREFDRQTVRERSLRSQSIQCAESAFASNPSKTLLNHLFSDYTRDLDALDKTSQTHYMQQFLLKSEYEKKKHSLEENFDNARRAKEKAISLADEQFRLATKPFREEADRKIAAHEKERDRKIGEISGRYEAFRRADRT